MKADFAGVQKEIAGVHKQIAAQTKWLVATIMFAITLYPVITKLISRLM